MTLVETPFYDVSTFFQSHAANSLSLHSTRKHQIIIVGGNTVTTDAVRFWNAKLMD